MNSNYKSDNPRSNRRDWGLVLGQLVTMTAFPDFRTFVHVSTQSVTQNQFFASFATFEIAVDADATPGNYEGLLIYNLIRGLDICLVDSTIVQLSIIEAQIPQANFSAQRDSLVEGGRIQFTSEPVHPATDWLWDFGDGQTSTDPSPVVTYVDPGVYNVSLMISGPGGSDSLTKESYIHVFPESTPGLHKWTYSGEEEYDEILTSPAIGENGSIYYGSNDGYLYALDENGYLSWKFKITGAVSSPILNQGRIYVGSGRRKVYCLNTTGREVWQYDLEDGFEGMALSADNILYATDFSANLYALSLNGDLLWKKQLHRDLGKPIIDRNNKVFVAGHNFDEEVASLYIFNSDGSLSDSTEFRAPISHNSIALVIGKDGAVYLTIDRLMALDPDLEVKWIYPAWNIYGGITSAPILDDEDNIYFGRDFRGEIHSLRSNGAINWVLDISDKVDFVDDGIGTGIIGEDGNLYFALENGFVVAVDKNGQLLWDQQLVEREFSGLNRSTRYFGPALTDNGILYAPYDNNILYAISTSSQGLLDGSWPKDGQNAFNYSRNTKAPPYLIAPANEAEELLLSPDFSWEALAEADNYNFQLSTEASFASNVADFSTEATKTTLEGIAPGNYFWRVRGEVDNEWGQWSSIWSFKTVAALSVDIDEQAPDCPVAATGSIKLNVDGGTGKYIYRWNNGSTTKELNFIGAGTYSCIIQDTVADLSISTGDIVLTDPEPISIDGIVVPATSNAMGSIQLQIEGGTPPYTISLNNMVLADTSVTDLAPGTYLIAVTDDLGCTEEKTFVVESSVSSHDLKAIADLSIIQKPGSQQYLVTIDFTNALGKTTLLISDALGRQILPPQEKRGYSLTFEVNLTNFPPGMYFITLHTKKHWHSEKVLLN